MNLYDKLKDKTILDKVTSSYDNPNLTKELKKNDYAHQLKLYDITTLWWTLHPNSNKIDIEELYDLFED